MRNKTLHQICRMIASGEIPSDVYNKYLGNTPIGFMTPLEIMAHLNNIKWIPVSERLPNDDEMSKCLYVNKYGDFIIDAYISKVGGTYECENEYTILCDVVAWMPLPEPYKESDK